MSKIIKYKCNNRLCVSIENTDELPKGWIEIGSTNNDSLKIQSKAINQDIISMGRHSDIHFCSRKCLIGYFFKEPNNEQKIWWGYLHTDESYQVKRYFDVRDINEALKSPFVVSASEPFLARNREEALKIIKTKL